MPSWPAAGHRLGYPAAGVNTAIIAPPGSATTTEFPAGPVTLSLITVPPRSTALLTATAKLSTAT